jgi:hypothetical protein
VLGKLVRSRSILISVLLELVVAVKELLVAVQRLKRPLNLGSGIFGRIGSTIVAIREMRCRLQAGSLLHPRMSQRPPSFKSL